MRRMTPLRRMIVALLLTATLSGPALASNIFVWDKDRGHVYPEPSGPGTEAAIVESLEANGFQCSCSAGLPLSLDGYDVIFIVTGWAAYGGDIPQFTAEEYARLTYFLNGGGSVFVDGNDFDQAFSGTELYSYFGCTYLGDGDPSGNISSLSGQPGTFTEGLNFSYPIGQSPDAYPDLIAPDDGFLIYTDQAGRARGVAVDLGVLHTVHLSSVFAALGDAGGRDTADLLMQQLLRFLLPQEVLMQRYVMTGGDGDEVLDPGEVLEFTFTVVNNTGAPVNDLIAQLSVGAGSEFVTVQAGEASFGSLADWGQASNSTPLRIAISPSAPELTAVNLLLLLTAPGQPTTWTEEINLVISSGFPYPAAYLRGLVMSGGTFYGTGESIGGQPGIIHFAATNVLDFIPWNTNLLSGIAIGDGSLWIAQEAIRPPTDVPSLYQTTMAGSVQGSFAVPCQQPKGLTFSDGDLYLLSQEAGSPLYRITTSGSVVSSINLPLLLPRGLSSDGSLFWAVDAGIHPPTDVPKIVALTSSGSVVTSVQVPHADPWGIALDGPVAWLVDNATAWITRVNIIPTTTPTPTISPTPTVTPATKTPTPSLTPSATGTTTPATATATSSLTATPSPTITATSTASPSLTATPQPTLTMSATATVTGTPSLTATPVTLTIALAMPGQRFADGDLCYLELFTGNTGAPRSADLYVLLDVFGDYWCYPSWQPLSAGLTFETVTVPTGDSHITLIPEFTMPAVGDVGPLYFYAAMFESGYLDLEHLISNGSAYEFSLGE